MKKAGRTRTEKDILSNLSNMVNYSEYIHANLEDIARTCGNKNCRCITKSQKHISLYLITIRRDGVRKMIYITKKLKEEARQMADRYFRIMDIIEEVSDINLERVLSKKK